MSAGFTKMLLVHPYTWQKLKDSGHQSDSVKVKENNENIIKEKIFVNNEKNKEWKDYSDRMVPILQKSREPLMTAISALSTPPAVSTPGPETVYDKINEDIAYNYRAKAIRLYNLLQNLKGVEISPEHISVEGKPLQGSTTFNLSQLIRGNKHLSFDLNELLNLIAGHNDIKRLISNKQAAKYLDHLSPGLSASPHSTPPPRRNRTALNSALNSSILSPPPKEKKGGKKKQRIIWKSLFQKYG